MPGKTIAEKILASKSGKKEVVPGEFVMANVDFAFGEDVTFPLAISSFKEIRIEKVWDPEKLALVIDHFFPPKDIRSANNTKEMKEFCQKFGIRVLDGIGIEHVILHELGFVKPGDLIVGADSHTTTFGALNSFATGIGSTDLAAVMATGKIWLMVPESLKVSLEGRPGKWITGKDIILHIIGKIGVSGATYMAMEFSGSSLKYLTMDDRFTISNMSIEAGAKAGIFEFDEKTEEYLKGRVEEYEPVEADEGAKYHDEREVNVEELEPTVALPHSPGNAIGISELKEEIEVRQVVIGSCTNGRLEDLRRAAEILRGRKVAEGVRLLIFPGSQEILLRAIEEGIIKDLVEAGATICPPTCGPCFGGNLGVLAPGEVAVSTTNRNFVGRMGARESKVILASPYVAAASAVLGRLASPDEVM